MEWLKEKINTFWKWLDHCFFQQKFLSINGEKANKSFKIPNSLPCFQKFLFYIIGFNRFTLMFQKLSPTSFQFFVALLLFMSTIITMQNLILEQKNVFLLAILQHKRGINVLIPFQKKKNCFHGCNFVWNKIQGKDNSTLQQCHKSDPRTNQRSNPKSSKTFPKLVILIFLLLTERVLKLVLNILCLILYPMNIYYHLLLLLPHNSPM